MYRLPRLGMFLGRLRVRSPLGRFCTVHPKTREEVARLTESARVVLFMKGDREQPLCGFSNLVVKILEIHGIPYETYNVLEDAGLRQGIKDYSDWPTIPQLYVNGKFVGGSDILLEMHQKGELVDFFKQEKLQSKLEEDGID